MTVEQAILARVLSLSTVRAITADRWWLTIYPQQPTTPAGRVQLVDDPAGYHLRGPDGTRRARVQVDTQVSEAAAANLAVNPYNLLTDLHGALEGDGKGPQASGLSGWVGEVGSPPFLIRGCFTIERRGPRYDPEELQTLTMSQDYYVWWAQ
jgi:hypothetical protein